jgi:hypothetical protein
VTYGVDYEGDENHIDAATLLVLSDARGTPTTQGAPIDLWRSSDGNTATARLHLWHDRLYVVGQRTIVFDVSDPLHPKRLSDKPLMWKPHRIATQEEPTIDLPAVPGMPAEERLKFALSCYDYASRWTFDGTLWCRNLYEDTGKQNDTKFVALEAVRVASLTDEAAHFELVGKYTPTLLQSAFNQENGAGLKMMHGLLYATQYKIVEVFDLTGTRPMRLIAHFVAPSYIREIEPLDDGRLIVGGDKLWLVGPPPKH